MLSKQRPLSKVYLMFLSWTGSDQKENSTIYASEKQHLSLFFTVHWKSKQTKKKKIVCHFNLSTLHPSFDIKQEGHGTKKYSVGKKVKREKCIWNQDHYFII